jgi:methionyl-tRNA synthetase
LTQYPFGIDGDIQAKRFAEQYNSDLANDLGNLVSRVVKLIETHFDGKLPEPNNEIDGLSDLLEYAEKLSGAVHEHISKFELVQAIAAPLNLVRATNKFFNDCAPWGLAKEGKIKEMGGVLYACSEAIRIASILLFPIMPYKMREVRAVFGLGDSTLTFDNACTFFESQPGTKVKLSQPIFPRMEKQPARGISAKVEGVVTANDDLLDYKDFARLKLRVAQVLEAEAVPNADKLLKLQIDLGTEKRQIVAGIAKHYKPESLIGRRIIVVANLKPAKIRGIESNGMLLAASAGDKLVLVTPDGDLPAGAGVS